jgi:hypothetical protein
LPEIVVHLVPAGLAHGVCDQIGQAAARVEKELREVIAGR